MLLVSLRCYTSIYDGFIFVYKLFSIHHWRPALLSLEPSNSSVWIDAAGIGYPKILSEFPAELEPSFQFTFTCFLQQPPTLLSISFSAAKHVAHITTPWFLGSTYLGWEKMYNMCCHISTQTPLLSFNAILRCLSSPDCQKNFRPRGEVASSWNLSLWQSQLKSWVGLSRAHWTGKSVGASRMSNRLQTYRTCPSKKQQKCAMKGEGSTKQNQLRILRFGWVFWTAWIFLFSFLQEKIENLCFLDTWGKKLFLSFYKGMGRCPAQTKNCFFLYLWNKSNYSHLYKYKSVILKQNMLKNLRSTGQPWLWG